jgi:branched-chain amino acid transport system substrate-binding protein
VFSAYGYLIIDAFAQAASKAGTNLTTDSFIKAMDTTNLPTDIFGSPPMTFSATKRLGSDSSRLSQITDGKWKVIADYARP